MADQVDRTVTETTPTNLRLSVIVPAYNEEQYVEAVVQRLVTVELPHNLTREIIVVDDSSTDSTFARLQHWGNSGAIRLLRHERNRGKGAALRTGFAAATGDIITIQDADLEYDPSELPQLLAPILDGRADTVFAARSGFLGGDCHRVMYFWHFVGNKMLTLACNMVSDLTLSDMECCYKMFRRDVLEQIRLRENRFGFEPEVVIKVARLRRPVYQVSVSYSGRTYEEGKKITWKDGAWALWCIIKYGVFRIG